jgi:hypothetical protein
MGRELRRVPPHWEHPKESRPDYRSGTMQECYVSMHDLPYIAAITEWIKNHQLWENGKHPDQKDEGMEKYKHFAQWSGNPPSVECYRPDWKANEMTWYQVYETVSEGTPVTPAFETQAELVEYLVTNGDFWDQKRRLEGGSGMLCGPWTRKEAESFVYGGGWSPSLIVANGKVMSGVEGMAEMQ